MPEGQYTGQRKAYLYTPDSGDNIYLISTDATLGGLTGTGLVEATTANVANAQPAPKRFKPRVVFWQGKLGTRTVRKTIACGTTDAALYDSDSPQAVTIDGVLGSTTGRRGERLSFLNLTAAADDGGGGGGAGG